MPFTYRGYLDINIGDYHLYYLGSRFYSPQLGRFLNADKHFDTGTGILGTNMYAYCNNNPVVLIDPYGESSDIIANQDQPLGIFEWLLAIVQLFKKVIPLITVPGAVVPQIDFSKTKIPSKLKDGDKVKTPDTHPDEFEKIKGTDKYRHKTTKWEFKRDRFHNRDHWDARPRNGKTGDYQNISLEGNIL